MVVDPAERMSAEEALQHLWLDVTNSSSAASSADPVGALGSGNIPEPAVWDKSELLGSLRGFTDSTLIQKVSLKVIAFHMVMSWAQG